MIRSSLLARRTLVALVLWAVVGCLVQDVKAYSPESPEVRALVKSAVQFIEASNLKNDGYYSRLGGKCLVGMTMYKYYHQPDHKLVQAAVAQCKAVCRAGVPWGDNSNYSVGIAVIFLAEVDAELYRPEIEVLIRTLMKRQMSNGGWSYSDHKTGDTSQTQYAVLGMWMAGRQNINVPLDAIERACSWLMRVQAPNGSWGYQGKDPGSYQRVKQDKETHSLTAAGLGSSYVCAELLGFISPPGEKKQSSGVPAALRQVGEDAKKKSGPITEKVPSAVLRQTLTSGDRWFDSLRSLQASEYQHYFMYAMERYMSFREIAEGSKNKEPDWYNWGVDYLGKTQAKNGSWKSCEAGPVIDSSFAVLFLLRSTQDSIKRIVEESGITRGGKYLPDDLSRIAVDSTGKVKDTKETPAIDLLMQQLEEGDINEIDASIPAQLKLSKDPKKRANELVRLRRMVMNGAFQARLTSVKTISRDRNIDNIPVLIYALSDPDYRVVKAAQNGLRYISRRVNGFGLKIGDKRPTKPQYVAAQDKWKTWYRSIRPDGALIE
ncbi:MAG: prenyltransferase/squalene oxidase repeat-containing protein [Pirellulaceae bacterium]|nr:prenyltransferase/squalene oxidase repeat-containing protein [Pirellulaceae bacterium]MDP6554092.1 prenyltransferase/squalene oxidase repeat-containing protein [Pirellulaceae bacterium]MDP6723416.1 prenyltransferase/squalene oxidase repeat-containing protein [Pirellulaceae bacterium]